MKNDMKLFNRTENCKQTRFLTVVCWIKNCLKSSDFVANSSWTWNLETRLRRNHQKSFSYTGSASWFPQQLTIIENLFSYHRVLTSRCKVKHNETLSCMKDWRCQRSFSTVMIVSIVTWKWNHKNSRLLKSQFEFIELYRQQNSFHESQSRMAGSDNFDLSTSFMRKVEIKKVKIDWNSLKRKFLTENLKKSFYFELFLTWNLTSAWAIQTISINFLRFSFVFLILSLVWWKFRSWFFEIVEK